MRPYKPIPPEVRAVLDALKAEGKANRAEAARENRRKNRRERIALRVQTLTLGILAATLGAAFWQVHEMILSTNAAISAARNAREALIDSNRPWVKVTEIPGGPIHFGSGQIFIPIEFVLTNVGHSPAVNVQVDPHLYFYGTQAFFHPYDSLMKVVRRWEISPHRHSEIVLFPGSRTVQQYVMSYRLDKIKWLFSDSQRPLLPAVLGVVAYFTRVDKHVHLTTFGIDVGRSIRTPVDIAKKRSADAIFADEGSVPVSNVRLTEDPMIGSYAN